MVLFQLYSYVFGVGWGEGVRIGYFHNIFPNDFLYFGKLCFVKYICVIDKESIN